MNKKRYFAGLSLLVISKIALSAPPPDAGTLLQGIEKQTRQPTAPPEQETLPKEPAPIVRREGVVVLVKGFHITGSKLLPESFVTEKLKQFIGHELTFTELEKVAQIVAEIYRSKGYVVRTYLPPQNIVNGVVEIRVIEGHLSSILIDSKGKKLRISSEVVQKIIESSQPIGAPARFDSIESGLMLLNEVPGVFASGNLEPGGKSGDTALRLKVQDGPLVDGSVDVNNYGMRSTGAAQAAVMLNVNDPSGKGDQITLRGLKSEGTDYMRVGYSYPIGYDGLRVGANVSSLNYWLVGDFAALHAYGSASTYGLMAGYPLYRSREKNASFSATVDHRHFVNQTLAGMVSDKVENVGEFNLSGNLFDDLLGGGFTVADLSLYQGNLNLNGDPANLANDLISANTQGSFWKLGANANRQQKITSTISLYAAITMQYAGKNLDPVEKFYLGGPSGVRAYPVNEAGGDSGYLVNLELRKNYSKQIMGFAFYDAGGVTQNKNVWNGWQALSNAPNNYSLSGAGFGVNVNWKTWIIKSSVAWRLGGNPAANPLTGADSDGSRHIPTGWIQIIKTLE